MCAAAALMSSEPRKVALLVGNNNYNKSPLTNCVNDATDLSIELKKVGFSLTTQTNVNYEDMDRGIENFTDDIRPGDFVLFFFAGHGVQWEEQNYLVPCDDDRIRNSTDLRYRAVNAQRALQLMFDKDPFVIVYLLDCCRTYWLPSLTRSRAMEISSRGMAPMSATGGSLIAFACAPGTTAVDVSSNGRNGLFTYHLLQHITKPGENITMLMIDVTQAVATETNSKQIPYTTSSLRRRDVYLVAPTTQNPHPNLLVPKVAQFSFNSKMNNSYQLNHSTISTATISKTSISTQSSIKPQQIQIKKNKFQQFAITVAGGNGEGQELNQLHRPWGMFIDNDKSIYIADPFNHRIIKWKLNSNTGQVVAGGNGQGNQNNQLNEPRGVIFDKKNNSFIISDKGNKRVIRYFDQNQTNQQIIISNIDCWGLAIDKNGFIYVSDLENHEVRRWKQGDKQGELVAGGNGHGNHLNQLYCPIYIFIDEDCSLYISDTRNHRVMKWEKDAKEGIIVAGGNGKGNSLNQLSSPQGVIVDYLGQIYAADFMNHRIMRWCEGDKEGEIVVGGNGHGIQSNQLSFPVALSFDNEENLYVADYGNHRVQKYEKL
ncbi:unnamed protein product [Adineta steineri]|uniref:Caspase family p20 domain-containing protein n=1 Tax=Adineta steineri TaxID=433720 RepID=A0A814EPI7_9BILA|nr:unnamed protein product [Adineta steineri]